MESQMPKIGDRIILVEMQDEKPVEPGTIGTVISIHVFAPYQTQIGVDWDTPRMLALIAEEDTWIIVPKLLT